MCKTRISSQQWKQSPWVVCNFTSAWTCQAWVEKLDSSSPSVDKDAHPILVSSLPPPFL